MTVSQTLCQLKGCTRLDHIRNELNWERTENNNQYLIKYMNADGTDKPFAIVNDNTKTDV